MKFDTKRTTLAVILLASLAGCGTSRGRVAAGQPKDSGIFPSVVRQVMMSLKGHTTIPLIAPTFVPTVSGHLTATTQPGGVSAKSYNVNVFATKAPIAVNAPSLAHSTYPEVASFGASRWPSSAQAMTAIFSWNANEGIVPQSPEQQHAVGLGYHVNATIYTMANVTSIQWHEGRWRFEVNDNHNVTRTALATQIVRFTHATPFPRADQTGLVIINDNMAGNHENMQSLVIWARGPIVYNVQTTRPLNALRMAVSMTRF